MGGEYVNNPCDPTENRFSWLEQEVKYINHNVNLLMLALCNNLWIFGEDGDSNVEEKSKGGSRDRKETDN